MAGKLARPARHSLRGSATVGPEVATRGELSWPERAAGAEPPKQLVEVWRETARGSGDREGGVAGLGGRSGA